MPDRYVSPRMIHTKSIRGCADAHSESSNPSLSILIRPQTNPQLGTHEVTEVGEGGRQRLHEEVKDIREVEQHVVPHHRLARRRQRPQHAAEPNHLVEARALLGRARTLRLENGLGIGAHQAQGLQVAREGLLGRAEETKRSPGVCGAGAGNSTDYAEELFEVGRLRAYRLCFEQ